MRSYLFLLSVYWLLMVHSVSAQESAPPQMPDTAPLISESYANDKDGNRIDDDLFEKAETAASIVHSAVSRKERIQAQARLDEMIYVELIFKKPITQEQINAFVSLGGKITYTYKTVSYGWNGQIPIGRIAELPSLMGPDLVLVDEPGQAVIH